MNRLQKSEVVCQHCDKKLAKPESLPKHYLSKSCALRRKQKLAYQIEKKEEHEAEVDIRVKPDTVAQPANASTMDPAIHSYFLGLVQQIVTRHGGRDDTKSKDNMLAFLEEEIETYNHTRYDPRTIAMIKQELKNWILAFRTHVNAVWEGVQEGVFNPARGRGGTTALQQEIVAAYMLAGWKKSVLLNEKTKSFLKQKMALYVKYESLQLQGTEQFPVPKGGNPLSRLYGEAFVWRSAQLQAQQDGALGAMKPLRNPKGEYVIQTIEDWGNVISYFNWLFSMLKKTVLTRLEHPMPILNLVKDGRRHYDEILMWLSYSPDGYKGPRSDEYQAATQ